MTSYIAYLIPRILSNSKIEVVVVSAGPKPDVGVVCNWSLTNQNLGPKTPLLHYYRR